MKVKYAKLWMFALLIIGLISSVFGYLASANGGLQGAMVLGPIMLLIGILGLVNPLYVFSDGVLQARNLLGMTLFRHPLEKLSVEPGAKQGERRLYVIKNAETGRKKRIMSTHTLSFNKSDVRALIDAVARQQA